MSQPVIHLLDELRELGVQLWVEEQQLRFRAPKGTITPALRQRLVNQKAELITFLTKMTPHELPSIERIPRTNTLPVSFSQQRLWFLDQFENQTAVYNIPLALRLKGPLNIKALQQSLNDIVRRHETLRTCFTMEKGQPRQKILPASELPLPLVQVPAEQVASHTTMAVQKPFNLNSDSLFRAKLLRQSPTEHVLLVTMHHIISDGWSLGVFTRELSTIYQAKLNGEPYQLPQLPIQYADFAHWQRNWLQNERLEQQLRYWQKQLAAAPPLLELPTDHPRPAVQSFHGRLETLYLSPILIQELRELSHKTETTLFMVLLATFYTLLYRHSNQEDIVVGSPIANRSRPEIEPLIGFFVNNLPLRVHLSPEQTFLKLLAQVREVALEAYAHQDVPFEKLVEVLQPERSLSHAPLFQVMFILQNTPISRLHLPGLTITPFQVDSGTAKFDLTLSLEETKAGLSGWIEYNTNLFEQETIHQLMAHFEILLHSVTAQPKQKLTELPMLTPAERQQLLGTWNQTDADYPKNTPYHQLFEAQVARTPQATAAIFGQTALTYAQLNERANRLAHHLRTMGVKPDMLVGVYLNRSLEMLVAVLGVLKAGGAYVPLDPAFPTERLAFMVADAEISLLLTQNDLRDHLPPTEATPLYLDGDWAKIAQQPPSNPKNLTQAHDLAYTIYTSGSTGKPKGVQIPHQALVNFINAMAKQPGFIKTDRLLAVTTLSFDIAMLELFLPLYVGGTVVIAAQPTTVDGAALLQHIDQHEISVMQATPATWRLMLEAGWQEARPLKIICGGEALPRDLADQLLPLVDSLWNLYGPTETTIWSTAYQVDPMERGPVSIGRPIDNTEIYLLNEAMQPVPRGAPGELYIGGDGLARGYLKRPKLTAEKFIPHPFQLHNPEARLYHTGDLARYRHDSTIEFFGRIDHQVKLRGFRIELGEIETLLNQHEQILQAVVIVWEESATDKRLVGYLVTETKKLPHNLRRYLKDHLPDYMVPAAFVVLDALPLTPNGKINRRALPAPNLTAISPIDGYVAPRDTLELQLVQMWEALLGRTSVGITDSFFELGGHSLLAVRLVSQIGQRFGEKISLATLFQGATIKDLAEILRSQNDDTTANNTPLVAISPHAEGQSSPNPFFCVHPADGSVGRYIELARHLPRPLYGLQALGLHTDTPPQTEIVKMALQYLEAIKTVQAEGPYLVGGWSMGGVVAFEISQQLQDQGHKVALLTLMDSWAPSNQQPEQQPNDTELLIAFLKDLQGRYATEFPTPPKNFEQLDPPEQLSYVLEQAKLLEAVLPEGDLLHIHQLLQLYKTNIRAMYHYTPTPYHGPVLFLQAEHVAPSLAEAVSNWEALTTQPLMVQKTAGNHYTMLDSAHVADVAAQLEARFNQATQFCKTA